MSNLDFFSHQDTLRFLNQDSALQEKITALHGFISERYPFIVRVAVAIYDPATDLLKTFTHSAQSSAPLYNYQAKLRKSASLYEIMQRGKPRLVNDLSVFANNSKEHSRRIAQEGYAASYTLPMYLQGEFLGFVFFNASQKNVFTPEVLSFVDVVGHLLSKIVLYEVNNWRILNGVVLTVQHVAKYRDPETGAHLERMARYTRLITRELAEKYALSDEFIERVFRFAPLHDIGKVAIPDTILFKPAKLTDEEFAVMKTHTTTGRAMVDNLLQNFAFSKLEGGEMLRNIVEFHHETLDGNGYPRGLRGDSIPLESLITAVADIFDALTSARPYKLPWTNLQAFETLHRLSGVKLHADSVAAFLNNSTLIEEIQTQFKEDSIG